jgi:ribosomal protein L3
VSGDWIGNETAGMPISPNPVFWLPEGFQMSPGILGKKIGMTQVFRPDGQAVPVTLLKAGPCMVVQRKTPTTDGYDAIQLGLLEFVKPSRLNKPVTGHLKKAGVEGAKFLMTLSLATGSSWISSNRKTRWM